MKYVVIAVSDDEVAEDVARLIGGTLTINGYDAGPPAVLDALTPSSPETRGEA